MFEIKKTDLAGRIGLIKTKNGVIETPVLLPVIHPFRQQVSTKLIKKVGFNAVMTNAYLTLLHHGEKAIDRGIHNIINFEGPIMTDSGGYQVLEYGSVKTNPIEMAKYEEAINTDIAVVLDTPTGNAKKYYNANKTVIKSIEAAKITLKTIDQKNNILWTGPIQGGQYLTLIRKSAKEMSKLDFNIYALGSPTVIMERYDFTLLADMIYNTKINIPLNKPLHLFGAGHPLTLPISVALGCDSFDSASYMLYAKDGRYLTESGTVQITDLTFCICNCPICSEYKISELKTEYKNRNYELIALHNLYQLFTEMAKIKQSIMDGRLWEYVGVKAKCHPKLWDAYRKFDKNIEYIEDGVPKFKKKAAFLTTLNDYNSPDIVRYRRKLNNITIPKNRDINIIIPNEGYPLYLSSNYKLLVNKLNTHIDRIQILVLTSIGIVPIEILDIYPISQNEVSTSLIKNKKYINNLVENLLLFIDKQQKRKLTIVIKRKKYDEIINKISKKNNNIRIIKYREFKEQIEEITELLKDY